MLMRATIDCLFAQKAKNPQAGYAAGSLYTVCLSFLTVKREI